MKLTNEQLKTAFGLPFKTKTCENKDASSEQIELNTAGMADLF